jgi:hypothetical protein
MKESIAGLEQKTGDISEAITEIKTDLKWHRVVGWGIAILYAGVFTWVLSSYLPDKFNDKLPSNFKEDWGGLKRDVVDIRERLNHLTPNTINELLPPSDGSTKPTTVRTQLRKASQVIDVALRTKIPGDPDSLNALRRRVADIAAPYTRDPALTAAAISAQVHLAGYAIASRRLLEGLQPAETSPLESAEIISKSSYLMGFTMVCIHSGAFFLESALLRGACRLWCSTLRLRLAPKNFRGRYGLRTSLMGQPLSTTAVCFRLPTSHSGIVSINLATIREANKS